MRIHYPFQFGSQDYPDDSSFSVTVFIMGCDTNCEGCFNPQFQNYNYSETTFEFSALDLADKIEEVCNANYTNKVCLSGGDPLSPINIKDTQQLLTYLIQRELEVVVYTSYPLDYLLEHNIRHFNFIKSGPYIEQLRQASQKTDEYLQFASTNQVLYDGLFNPISENGRYSFKEVQCSKMQR